MRNTAIVDWFGYNNTPQERMRLIKEADFTGVILLWTNQFDSDYQLFPEQAQRAGLYVENAHAPYEQANSLWLDTLDGDDYAKSIIKTIEECSQRGVSTIVMHPANGNSSLPNDDIGIERLRRIIDYAEKLGVNIAMENMESPQFLEYIYNRIESPCLGFCFDSGHHNLYSPQLDLLNMYGEKLMALHLHDNDSKEDQHALPFTGNVDWESLGKTLDTINYKGAVALEVRTTGFEHIENASEFLKIAFDKANNILK